MMLTLSSKTYGVAEIAAISNVLTSGNVTMGQEVEAFEREFAEYIGVKHAIMVNSGSSANMLAMLALDATHNFQQIAAPALTWATTITPFLMRRVRVALLDCDPDTLQISPDEVYAESRLHNPDAVIIAHIMGNACDMDKIGRYVGDTPLIEDSCEALGTAFMGVKTGNFGAAASFSFYFSHHITTIEGGMVVTEYDDVANRLRSIRSHGLSRVLPKDIQNWFEVAHKDIDPDFLFAFEGHNFRPTELQGAMGRVQLRKLDSYNQSRMEVWKEMRRIVEPREHLHLRTMKMQPAVSVQPFAFPVICEDADRDRLSAHLNERHIHTRPIVAGNLALHPAFKNNPLVETRGELPHATDVMKNGLYWGVHPNVTDKELRELENALDSYEPEQ